MKTLLRVTAVLEGVTGLTLLLSPALTVSLLLGASLDRPAAVTLGRVAGMALLALGVACGLAHYDAQSRAARGLITAMTLYNLGAVVILCTAGIGSQPVGVALWPTVVLHAGMTVWCITPLLGKPTQVSKEAK